MFPNFNNTGVNPMGMGNNPNNVPNMNLMGKHNLDILSSILLLAKLIHKINY